MVPANNSTPGSKSEHQSIDNPRSSLPAVVSEDLEALQQSLERKNHDYAVLKEAHTSLTNKFRKVKRTVEQWINYDSRTLNDAEPGNRLNGATEADRGIQTPSTTPLSTTRSNPSLKSKSFSSSTASSTVDISRYPPIQPGRSNCSESSSLGHPSHQEPNENQPLNTFSLGAGNSISRADVNTVTSAELGTHKNWSPNLINPLTVGPTAHSVGQANTRSESPEVVSERCLKRKRASGSRIENSAIYQGTKELNGSAATPVRVKSEHGSSSPLIPDESRGTGLIQDSLDLDEVGTRITTPTKRRRVQDNVGIQNRKASLAFYNMRWKPGVDESASLGHNASEEAFETSRERNFQNPGPSCSESRGHDHASMPSERLKNEQHRTSEEDVDSHAPDRLRVPQRPSLARRSLHDERATNSWIRNAVNQIQSNSAEEMALTRTKDRTWVTCGEAIATDLIPQQLETHMSPAYVPGPIKPLQPLTPNPRVLPRTSDPKQISKKSIKRRDRGPPSVSLFAEDGEEYNAEVRHKPEALALKAKMESSISIQKPADPYLRLQGLLTEKSPEKPILAKKPTNMSAQRPRQRLEGFLKGIDEGSIFQTPEFKIVKPGEKAAPSPILELKSRKAANPISSNSSEKPLSATKGGLRAPKETPLRNRPLHQLSVDDFKINPACNQGYNYAFSDVIRNRDQRKCLPNCTNPGCCGGKFRKMVEIGGFPASSGRRLWETSSKDEEDPDTSMLEEFLGGDARHLTTAERNELLVQARSKKFADQHGKHRHLNERAASPPGFWRTDMPTTQEEQADREEAIRLERARVEERFREATQIGGRWLFRDE